MVRYDVTAFDLLSNNFVHLTGPVVDRALVRSEVPVHRSRSDCHVRNYGFRGWLRAMHQKQGQSSALGACQVESFEVEQVIPTDALLFVSELDLLLDGGVNEAQSTVKIAIGQRLENDPGQL